MANYILLTPEREAELALLAKQQTEAPITPVEQPTDEPFTGWPCECGCGCTNKVFTDVTYCSPCANGTCGEDEEEIPEQDDLRPCDGCPGNHDAMTCNYKRQFNSCRA